MGTPTTGNRQSAAIQLRQALLTYFDVSDLESLCFDLGVDYDALPGEGKAARVVELIEYCARTGRVVELIDHCAGMRPNVGWAEIRSAAISTPGLFQSVAPLRPTDGQGQLLNLPPDRALKIGIAIGILAVLLLLCGFSGGLLASRFVAITLSPIPVNEIVGARAAAELQAFQAVPAGSLVQITYDNVKATSLADRLLVSNSSPISEIHIQFLEDGDIGLNVRLRALGNRRVVIGLGVSTQNGRLVLRPIAVALNVLELEGSTFGWVYVPTSLVNPFIEWLQKQLDAAGLWFERVSVAPDHLEVVVRKR